MRSRASFFHLSFSRILTNDLFCLGKDEEDEEENSATGPKATKISINRDDDEEQRSNQKKKESTFFLIGNEKRETRNEKREKN